MRNLKENLQFGSSEKYGETVNIDKTPNNNQQEFKEERSQR